MKRSLRLTLFAAMLTAALMAQSGTVTYSISTASGSAAIGDGGLVGLGLLMAPDAAAYDSAGNLFIADAMNHRVRKVDAKTNIISTVAGVGMAGYGGDNGPGDRAQLRNPVALAFDAAGNLYIADRGNHRVRRLDTNGVITTLAGTGLAGYSGDGKPATNARLRGPSALAIDSAGAVYIADTFNNRVRAVDTKGVITTVAGIGPNNAPGGWSGDNGPAVSARLNQPEGLAIDASGALYIADTQNHRIRKVSSGTITTFAGTCLPNLRDAESKPIDCSTGTPSWMAANILYDGQPATMATLAAPRGIAFDSTGNLIIADQQNNRIRRIAPDGIIHTLAGQFYGYLGDGQAPASAWFANPRSVGVDANGNVVVADRDNGRIRLIDRTNAYVTTVAGNSRFSGDGGPAASAVMSNPRGLTLDGDGNLYVADTNNNRVRQVSAGTGIINTIAGGAVPGLSGDGGQALNSRLNGPSCVAVDAKKRLFVADRFNHRVRMIDTDGTITTVAGGNNSPLWSDGGYSGDNMFAMMGRLNSPSCVAVDANGALYIADTNNHAIRTVSADGYLSTLAGNGTAGSAGDGLKAPFARFNSPQGIAADANGAIYVADTGNHVVRKIAKDGTVSLVAGIYNDAGSDGDGSDATLARLNAPQGVAVDSQGNVFIADTGNSLVRRVDAASGVISTVAGGASVSMASDGFAGASANVIAPVGLAIDSQGAVYVSDRLGAVRKLTPSMGTN